MFFLKLFNISRGYYDTICLYLLNRVDQINWIKIKVDSHESWRGCRIIDLFIKQWLKIDQKVTHHLPFQT